MARCPNCGGFMQYHMTGGGSYYTCLCGFGTRDIVITYSNTTQDSKPSRIVYGANYRVVEVLDDEQRSKILRKIT